MKYNVPYGLADETTLYSVPYINGNPTTGTKGSIPPAASIEYDQREIVAVIQYAANLGLIDYANQVCQNPSNADLQQLLKAIFGMINANKLTAPRTYYVNTHTGDDSFTGLTPTTAFKTLQRAINQSSVFNLNGFSITIIVADGIYGAVALPAINGTGRIYMTGNQSIPGNCIIHANQGPAVLANGGTYILDGFRFESDAPSTTTGFAAAGVWASPGGHVEFASGPAGSVEFGFCQDAHMIAQQGSIGVAGGSTIRICGNTTRHIFTLNSGWFYTSTFPSAPNLVIPAAQNCSFFVHASTGGTANPVYASISGKANMTATRYTADLNGVINTAGGGATSLPGTIAGTTATGGQYS